MELDLLAMLVSIVACFWAWFVKWRTGTDLAKVKSDLKILENEYSIRLEHISKLQLEAMIDLYHRFAELDGCVQYYSGSRNWEELAKNPEFKDIYDKICEFQIAFYKSKVFLTKSLENDFLKLIDVLMKLKVMYRLITDANNYDVNKTILDERSQIDSKYIHEEFPKLRESIELEFRSVWRIRT